MTERSGYVLEGSLREGGEFTMPLAHVLHAAQ
jgi:hypothetical protein